MTTSAKLGSGAILALGSGASPQVYTTVEEVLRISEVGQENPEVPVTHLQSTSVERIAGLKDGKTFDFTMNYIQGTQQQALRTAVLAGDTKHFKITWPFSPETTAVFDCVCLDFSTEETTSEVQVTAVFRGRITGDVTWTN